MAGFVVTPTSGLVTAETGGSATFTVRLTSQPVAEVNLGLSSSDPTEGAVAPTSLTFTATNWNTPQTVTVTGLDDLEADGDLAYAILIAAAVSNDPGYDGLDPAKVSVINTDFVALTLSVQAETIDERGGTTTATVSRTDPRGDLLVRLSSSDPGAAIVTAAVTIPAGQTMVTVAVLAVNDGVPDGNQTVSIVASADGYRAGQDCLEVLDAQVWQNARNRYDVNGDLSVTPQDVLLLITEINVAGTRVLPSRQLPQAATPPYLDVSGDGNLSPADVLWVINDLNTYGPRAGEGEAARPGGTQASWSSRPLAATAADATPGGGTELWAENPGSSAWWGPGESRCVPPDPPPAWAGLSHWQDTPPDDHRLSAVESSLAAMANDVQRRWRQDTLADSVLAEFAELAE